MGRGLWQMLVDFVFPPHCPVCHAYVEHLGAWCPDCMAAAQKPHVILLPAAMQPLIGTAWALGRYHGGLRSLIHALKYKKKRSALPCIATFLRESDFVLPTAIDMAVPVPLHEARYRERGFNQVELIFGAWLEGQGLPLEQALVRTKQTGPLYRMRPSERRQSLKDAFSMARDADVSGKHILLLDDILTTGATLSACAAARRGSARRRARLCE